MVDLALPWAEEVPEKQGIIRYFYFVATITLLKAGVTCQVAFGAYGATESVVQLILDQSKNMRTIEFEAAYGAYVSVCCCV